MPNVSVNTLKSYISAEMNVIIAGLHGVGKTAKLKKAVSELGWKMKYFSASTMDPFTELIGIPVPNTETKTIEYYRPLEIDDAEVIFIDEYNRADERTSNALMEIILEKSINGVPLPKLKAVVAAINPVTEDYDTTRIDAAQLDRFDIFLTEDPAIDLGFFVGRFGEALGKAAVEYWNEYHSAYVRSMNTRNPIPYISPRRMEIITSAFQKLPNRQTVVDTLPMEIADASVAGNIFRRLSDATKKTSEPAANDVDAIITNIIEQPISVQRNRATAVKVNELIKNGELTDVQAKKLVTSLAVALNEGKSPRTLVKDYLAVLQLMSPSHIAMLTSGWGTSKRRELDELLWLR